MKKMVLIDGTNLIFRSYYATAVVGRLMRNSKGMPTNGLFGFVNMINKIINEEQADYYVVALDEGKTFRHQIYDDYKQNRSAAPEELVVQLNYIKPILEGMGVKWLTQEGYEADDIVGSLAKQFSEEIEIVAISSDQDYLQLIDDNVIVKLLKKSDYKYYDSDKFFEDYGITPKQIIDLKALEGDKSDNISGVSGVGAKTALKLISEYGSVEGIYDNIDGIKGKLQEKLINDKDNAFFSKQLVTIYTDLRYNLDELKYLGIQNSIRDVYEELEFNSFLKKIETVREEQHEYQIITELKEYLIDDSYVFFDFFGLQDHEAELLGMSIINDKGTFYIEGKDIIENIEVFDDVSIYTYDIKKAYYYFYKNFEIKLQCKFDFMLAFYLLDLRGNELSEFARPFGGNLMSDEALYGKGVKYKVPEFDKLINESICRVYFLSQNLDIVVKRLKAMDLYNLYCDVEMPLAKVIAKMEHEGIHVDLDFLKAMDNEVNKMARELEDMIFEVIGYEFNINSYQQLGKALFIDLGLPYPKKLKPGQRHKTSVDVLEKIAKDYEVVQYILEFRMLRKLSSTYLEGLQQHIKSDGKIHTVYNQALTSTGRLSSTDPNLQNIPIRTELGRKIRKAFIPSDGCEILACDYSQIELRLLAELAGSEALISAFSSGEDIHTKTASEIFGVDVEKVDETMRRHAKAVNFGIVYGMSDFGLSQSTGVSVAEAKSFISRYFEVYDNIKLYLDQVVSDATIHGYSRTMFNRIRYIEELKSKNYIQRHYGERLAMNTPLQGSAADIIKIAMIKINQKFEEHNIKTKMLLQIHDELIFDCIKEEKEQVLEIVVNEMKNAYYTPNITNDFRVTLEVDYGFGSSWYEAK